MCNLKIVYSTLRKAGRRLPVFDAGSIAPASIPPRAWLMQNRLLRKYVTVTIAPGGVGKTMLGALECTALVTGESYTGYNIVETGNALLFNAEDPLDEMKMRVTAIADYFNIPLSSLHNKLHLISGRDFRCRLVTYNKELEDYVVNEETVGLLRDFIRQHNISLLYLDPFIRIHDVPENDNVAIDKVVELLTDLSEELNCSVSIAHHSRKHNGEGGAGDQDTSRGASSLISAARIAHTLTAMSESEAKLYGLDPERRNWYVRMDDAKVNLAPPADQITWFEKKSVIIANGESVGVLKRLELTKAEKLDPDEEMIDIICGYLDDEGKPVSIKEAVEIYQLRSSDERSLKTLEYHVRKLISDEKCQLVVLQNALRNSNNRKVDALDWKK